LRITAAIARIVRAHAQALDDLASVFGHDSDVASVLAAHAMLRGTEQHRMITR